MEKEIREESEEGWDRREKEKFMVTEIETLKGKLKFKDEEKRE